MLYFLAVLAGFITGYLMRRKPPIPVHKHKLKVICSLTSDKVPLEYRYGRVEGAARKHAKDVHVVYQVCECGYEEVILSDGTCDRFYFDEKIYIAKMKEQAMIEEFKRNMGIL